MVNSIPWNQNQIKIFGKNFLEPRLTQFYGPAYSYSNVHWPKKPFPSVLKPLLENMNNYCGFEFNAALLNYYRNGTDSMGWHSDNEKEMDQSCIASLSLGATRKFKLRLKEDHSTQKEFLLENNSLLIMRYFQERWQHSIPKTTKNIEARINITFRKILS